MHDYLWKSSVIYIFHVEHASYNSGRANKTETTTMSRTIVADAILLSDSVAGTLTAQLGHQSQLRLLRSELNGAHLTPHIGTHLCFHMAMKSYMIVKNRIKECKSRTIKQTLQGLSLMSVCCFVPRICDCG